MTKTLVYKNLNSRIQNVQRKHKNSNTIGSIMKNNVGKMTSTRAKQEKRVRDTKEQRNNVQ